MTQKIIHQMHFLTFYNNDGVKHVPLTHEQKKQLLISLHLPCDQL